MTKIKVQVWDYRRSATPKESHKAVSDTLAKCEKYMAAAGKKELLVLRKWDDAQHCQNIEFDSHEKYNNFIEAFKKLDESTKHRILVLLPSPTEGTKPPAPKQGGNSRNSSGLYSLDSDSTPRSDGTTPGNSSSQEFFDFPDN